MHLIYVIDDWFKKDTNNQLKNKISCYVKSLLYNKTWFEIRNLINAYMLKLSHFSSL